MAGEKILIIEDNKLNLDLIVSILEIRGYKIFIATDGFSGLNLAKEELPDLILLDMQLPVMDGYEVARALRKDPILKNIFVIAITSYAMKGDREKILEAGCDAYIVKPIDTRKLPERIEELLKTKGV